MPTEFEEKNLSKNNSYKNLKPFNAKFENILHRNVTSGKPFKNIFQLSLMAFWRARLSDYSLFSGEVSDFMFIGVPFLFQFVNTQSC